VLEKQMKKKNQKKYRAVIANVAKCRVNKYAHKYVNSVALDTRTDGENNYLLIAACSPKREQLASSGGQQLSGINMTNKPPKPQRESPPSLTDRNWGSLKAPKPQNQTVQCLISVTLYPFAGADRQSTAIRSPRGQRVHHILHRPGLIPDAVPVVQGWGRGKCHQGDEVSAAYLPATSSKYHKTWITWSIQRVASEVFNKMGKIGKISRSKHKCSI